MFTHYGHQQALFFVVTMVKPKLYLEYNDTNKTKSLPLNKLRDSQKLFMQRRARIYRNNVKDCLAHQHRLPRAKPAVWLKRLQTFVVDLIVRQENPVNKTLTEKLNLQFNK